MTLDEMLAGYQHPIDESAAGDKLQQTFGIMRSEMVNTMKELKDTLSLSLGTMNQTLSSVHETLKSINMHISTYAQQRSSQYIASPSSTFFSGGMSHPMQNYLGKASFMDLLMNDRPFNVDPREFYANSALERDRRMSAAFTDAAFTGLQGAAVIGGTSAIESGVGALLAKRGMAYPGIARMGVGIAGSIAMGTAMQAFNWGDEASAFARNTADIRRLSPRTGREFSENESMNLAQHLRKFAFEETKTTTAYDTRLGGAGAESLLKTGMAAGLFQADNPEQLVKQFEQAAGVVRVLAGVMGSKDITETINTMITMKAMGKNLVASPHELKHLNDESFKYSALMGMNRGQLMNDAMRGAQQIYPQFGMPSYMGIVPMMQNMAFANELEKRRLLSPGEMSTAGGVKGMAQTMTQFQAGLQRNPTFGGLAIGAGMTSNGQFDASRAQNVVGRGNYFETANSAAQNILSGGPARYLLMKMETNNLIESLNDKGEKGEITKEILKQAIALQMDAIQPKTYMEKLAVATHVIQEVGNDQGTPIDTATAKALAMQLMSPQMMKDMDKEGRRHMNRGDFSAIAARNSPARVFSRLGEAWDTFSEGFSYYKDAAPAQAVYSWFSDALNGEGRSDRLAGIDAGARPLMSDYALQNAARLKPMRDQMNAFKGSVTPDEINAGFWAGGEHISHKYNYLDPLGMMTFGANKNITTAMQIMAGQEWKDYYAGMAEPGKRKGNVADAYFAVKDKAGFNSISSMMADFKDSTHFNKLGGGFHWAMSKMYSQDSINKAAADLESRFSDLKGMKGIDKIDALAASRGFKEGTTPEAVIAGLTGTAEIREFAKANNINERQAAYLYAKRRFGDDIGMSYKSYAMGTSEQAEAEKIGQAMEGATYSTSTIEHLRKITGVSLDTDMAGARELLGDIGMTEGIDKLVTGQSPETLRAFNKAMGMIVTGEHITKEEEFKKLYGSLSGSKALQNQLSDVMGREKENEKRFRKYRGTGGSYTDPVTGVEYKLKEGVSSDQIAATLEGAQSNVAAKGVRSTMSRIWGLSDEHADEFLKKITSSGGELTPDDIMGAFKSISDKVDKGNFSKSGMFLESNRIINAAADAFGYSGAGSLKDKKVSQLSDSQKRALQDINPNLFKQITQDTNMSQEQAMKLYFNTALSAGMSDAGAKELNKQLKIEDTIERAAGNKPAIRVIVADKTDSENARKESPLEKHKTDGGGGNSKLGPAGPNHGDKVDQ